jgi:hypothetical protein
MNIRRKIRRSITHKDEAVAGIVVAVMIVGLILAVISIIQTVYIPKWMETRESEHMGVVADQFSQMKFVVDSQIALRVTSPISSSVTLGSRELGFFMSNKAFGRLSLVSNGWSYKITRTVGDTYEDYFGTLRYTSENAYFLDQSYNYEIGGVVLNQTQGAVFSIKPEFTAAFNTSVRKVNLSWTCISLLPKDDKTSISGYGTYPVKTAYLSTTNTNITLVKTFTIYTPFPTIWMNFLNSSFADVNLVKNTHYTITKASNQVTVTFLYPPITDVVLNLKKVSIIAQITPGWTE